MLDLFRPIAARVVGSLVGSVATWLAIKWGVQLDDGARGQLTDGIVSVGLAVFGVVYSLVHRTVSLKLNPVDAASPSLAQKSKQETQNPSN